MSERVLSRRELSRALLARQLLLEPAAMEPLAALEHLVGMQAQEPQAPYVGLWTRLADFDPQALSELIESRRAVRAGLMRVTVHLVSAADYRRLCPLLAPVLARQFRGSQYSKQLGGAPPEELAAVGRGLLSEGPQTRPELGRALAERWPEGDPTALGYAATLLSPVVQSPPRGLWRRGGQARWIDAQTWLGGEALDGAGRPEPIIRRYLAAFGPASVRDIQAWSGLTRLAAVLETMRGELRSFRDERGVELFDVPDGPLPDPDTPAPPRILPPFDNAILAHGDRERIISAAHRDIVFQDRLMRTFLLDGFVAGRWRVDGATLTLTPLRRLSAAERKGLTGEARRLLGFLAPGRRGRVEYEAAPLPHA